MRETIKSKIESVRHMSQSELNTLKMAIAVTSLGVDELGALIDAIKARESEIESLKSKFADNGELKGDEIWQ